MNEQNGKSWIGYEPIWIRVIYALYCCLDSQIWLWCVGFDAFYYHYLLLYYYSLIRFEFTGIHFNQIHSICSPARFQLNTAIFVKRHRVVIKQWLLFIAVHCIFIRLAILLHLFGVALFLFMPHHHHDCHRTTIKVYYSDESLYCVMCLLFGMSKHISNRHYKILCSINKWTLQ